jgi:hypothetical protein
MVTKASLLNILESIKSNTIASNDGIVGLLFETATSTSDRADVFAPNALEELDSGTRYYSLYDGNAESIGNPEFADIPKDDADSVFIRYFDVDNDRLIYVSNWLPIDVPPDGIPDEHRFNITDHTGRVVDVTDLEWHGDLPKVNLTKLRENSEEHPEPKQETKSIDQPEQGGFRLWYIMIEIGRNGEAEGKGDRVDHKVGILATPRKFPTTPFMGTLNQLPGVSNTGFNKTTRSTYISAEIPEHDMRVLLFENSPEPKIYPSEDMLDITQELAAKHKTKISTVKTFASMITPIIASFTTPKPVDVPTNKPKSSGKRKVTTTKSMEK